MIGNPLSSAAADVTASAGSIEKALTSCSIRSKRGATRLHAETCGAR
jgi:hypothetical protein